MWTIKVLASVLVVLVFLMVAGPIVGTFFGTIAACHILTDSDNE